MTDDLCRLRAGSDEWIWDTRAGLLCLKTHSSPLQKFEFPLGSFSQIEPRIEKLNAQETKTLVNALNHLTQTHPSLPRQSSSRRSIRHALGTLAFRLHCFSLQRGARDGWLRKLLSRLGLGKAQDCALLSELKSSAEAVLRWLGADGPTTAWRSRYLKELGYERCYQLVELGRHVLEDSHGSVAGAENTQVRLSQSEIWEALWWTTRCQYELASEWYQEAGHASPAARHALLDSSALYLRMLKDEPRRQALDQFLASIGSDREREVIKIFSLRSQLRKEAVIAKDEAASRAFGGWLLNRYSLWRAGRLVWLAGPHRKELVSGAIGLGLIMMGAALFFLPAGWWAWAPFIRDHRLSSQIGFQLTGLVVIVAGAPSWFRLMLPRALFGSLLAWLTIILLQVVSTFPPAVQAHDFIPAAEQTGTSRSTDNASEAELREACHRWLKDPVLGWSKVTVLVASIFVCFTFIINEVRGRILRGVLLRSVLSLLIMLLGALFWAAIFSHPIRFLIEGRMYPGDCNCTYSIWLIGGVLSALFGLLVQLLWDDRSIADPLGESA